VCAKAILMMCISQERLLITAENKVNKKEGVHLAPSFFI
jgi:hypothetical protein